MVPFAHTDASPRPLHDDLRQRLSATERSLRDVLEQLARAEGELARVRAASQVEARRGY